MMSVIIKGMKMPTSCMDCPFKGFDRANGRGNVCIIDESISLHAVFDGLDVKFVRMGDCPLIEVPPHGRLIDADKLRAEFPHPDDWRKPELAYAHLSGIWATIDCAETIIGAERTE